VYLPSSVSFAMTGVVWHQNSYVMPLWPSQTLRRVCRQATWGWVWGWRSASTSSASTMERSGRRARLGAEPVSISCCPAYMIWRGRLDDATPMRTGGQNMPA